MLVELGLVEQRYRAVCEVLDGATVVDVVWDKLSPAWTSFPLVDLPELEHLTAPTPVVAADHDMVTVEHAAIVSRAIPNGRLAVVPGEHSVPLDKPGVVASLVLDFLSELDVRS